MMEGELAYDYGINFEEAYRNVANGNITAIKRTSVGVTHGLFGPTLQPAKGGFRPFATLKGGFTDFRLSPSLLPFGNVVSTILGIRTSSLNVAIYPGGGVEASLGLVPDTWSSNQLAYQMAFRYGDFNAAAAVSVDLIGIGLIAAVLIVKRTGLFRTED